MKDDDVLRLLRAACKQAGSQNKWAQAHGIKQQLVNATLTGKRAPGPTILAALGIERVQTTTTRYARVNEP
jgi:hypothetical protein